MMSSSSLHRRATPLCLDPEILHVVKIRLVLYISDQIEEKTLKKFCSKKWLSPGIRLVVYISDQIEEKTLKKFCSKKWLSPGIRLVVYISDQIEKIPVTPLSFWRRLE